MFLTCTVHRRHPHSKVREYFIGYALHPEEEEEEKILVDNTTPN